MTRTIESKDGKRIWTITERDGQFHCSGVRANGTGWDIAGHGVFFTLETALYFAESMCGLNREKPVDA